MKKPNILFFLSDDQRFDTIGILGNEEIHTPNIDAFSKDCMVFTQGHIMGATSGAVCMPSRAMIQTGRTLFNLYGKDTRNGAVIPEKHTTLPEHLRENGYRTHHIGKWHQDKASFIRSYENADRIFGIAPVSAYYSLHYSPALLDYDSTGVFEDEKAYNFNEQYGKVPAYMEKGSIHSTDVFADAAVNFIEHAKDDERPFYLYCATVAPHDPRQAPNKYEEMYNSDNVSCPENFLPEHPFDNGELHVRDELLEAFPRRKHAIKRHIADYYAIISHLDARFGDVVQSLKDEGLYDDTIIIYSGDNGLALGQHGLMGKQSVYEHSCRVPLMIKLAGQTTTGMNDSYCYLLDIFPTLCDMIELPIPDSVEGLSLMSVIKGEKKKTRDKLFCAYRNVQRSIKDGRYKLIEYTVNGSRRVQLFDLKTDPLEMLDLSQSREHSKRVKDMIKVLREQQETLNDPLVSYNEEEITQELDSVKWKFTGTYTEAGGPPIRPKI